MSKGKATITLFPEGYLEAVFRVFDFANRDQIRLDDLPCVLTALGYKPDAVLSAAMDLMLDENNGRLANTVHLSRFITGMEALQESRGGRDDVIANSFRLFDIQRRGVVSVEDMLATVCLDSTVITAEECKEIVVGLKGSTTIKGLSQRDFKLYLGA